MDDSPEFQPVLKPFRGKDVFDYLRGELVFGTTPKSGKSKLSVGVHRRFLRMPFRGCKNWRMNG